MDSILSQQHLWDLLDRLPLDRLPDGLGWKPVALAAFGVFLLTKASPLVRRWRRASTPGVPLTLTLKGLSRVQQCIKEWMEQHQAWTGWYHVWFGFDFTMLTADPDCAQWVLRHHELPKTDFVGIPSTFKDTLGQHLVIVNGDVWKRQRSAINSGFTTESYKSYFDSFNLIIDKCLTKLSELPEGTDVDISPYLSRFTLDLLGKSIFHYDFNTLNNGRNEYYDAYRTIINGGGPFNQLLVEVIPGWSHLPFFGPRKFYDACQTMIRLFKRVIEEHQKEGNFNDVLDKLLQYQAVENKLSEVELYSNIWAFFAAGHETTANALAWAFAELADKEGLQERLYEHVLEEFPSGTPSVEAVLRPPAFLDGFVKENLRHHPPVSIIPTRRTARDLLCGEQVIPAGTRVGVDVWAIHHNPRYWEDPEVFDPERFLPERRKGKHRFCYLPFGLGPRQCIGNEFSEIEQRLFLVKFLREFKVLPPVNQPKVNLNELPNFGAPFPVHVRLQRRK